MDVDYDKIDDYTLALLYLGTSQGPHGARAWRAFDQATMDRLHEKGYIDDSKSKALSVTFSDEGLTRAQTLFEHFFTKGGSDLT